jgi:hypothetical protein
MKKQYPHYPVSALWDRTSDKDQSYSQDKSHPDAQKGDGLGDAGDGGKIPESSELVAENTHDMVKAGQYQGYIQRPMRPQAE